MFVISSKRIVQLPKGSVQGVWARKRDPLLSFNSGPVTDQPRAVSKAHSFTGRHWTTTVNFQLHFLVQAKKTYFQMKHLFRCRFRPVSPRIKTLSQVCVFYMWMKMCASCVLKQHPTALCPPEYMVCFLHRLITAVRACWDEGNRKSPGSVGSEGTTESSAPFY